VSERKHIPKKERLTIKQETFARALVHTGSPQEAAKVAYPTATPASQLVLGKRAAGNPVVVRRVDQLLTEKYPDHETDFAKVIKLQLERIVSGAMKDRDANEFLKIFSKIKGYEAPSQHQTMRATLKLPSE
jgi:hypothetical protein